MKFEKCVQYVLIGILSFNFVHSEKSVLRSCRRGGGKQSTFVCRLPKQANYKVTRHSTYQTLEFEEWTSQSTLTIKTENMPNLRRIIFRRKGVLCENLHIPPKVKIFHEEEEICTPTLPPNFITSPSNPSSTPPPNLITLPSKPSSTSPHTSPSNPSSTLPSNPSSTQPLTSLFNPSSTPPPNLVTTSPPNPSSTPSHATTPPTEEKSTNLKEDIIKLIVIPVSCTIIGLLVMTVTCWWCCKRRRKQGNAHVLMAMGSLPHDDSPQSTMQSTSTVVQTSPSLRAVSEDSLFDFSWAREKKD